MIASVSTDKIEDKNQYFKFDEERECWLNEAGEITLRYVQFSSENIKKLRKELKITQEQLADDLGVTRPLITQYETGYLKNPYSTLLSKLGQVFSKSAGHKIVFYVDWETPVLPEGNN